MILTFAVSGYRSLRDLVLPLAGLTVITGPNGSGKSSFYRALRLLSDVAQGRVVPALAAEGGLQSTLWAGPENVTRRMRLGEVPVQGGPRKRPVALRLGFAAEDYGYALDLGLPAAGGAFPHDPEIKAEALWIGEALSRRNAVATRAGGLAQVQDASGRLAPSLRDLDPWDSMMTHAADPRGAPELTLLRDRMRRWRFYDHFRTDPDAPARRPCIGTRTLALSDDGRDLAAAILTLRDIGDGPAFDAAIADAFEGAEILTDGAGIQMIQRGLLRPLDVQELSDGTLRYLLLAAALLTPRPPELIVLNEPETSLHPDLLAPLGRLIAEASRNAQIVVVTHADPLAQALSDAGAMVHALRKDLGETRVEGAPPRWDWPKR